MNMLPVVWYHYHQGQQQTIGKLNTAFCEPTAAANSRLVRRVHGRTLPEIRKGAVP